MRRVAITGAQGTGKSTLARRVGEVARDRGIPTVVLEGIGRAVAELGFPLGKNATADTVCAFAAAHLKRERETSCQLIVQDRCLLDLYAYSCVLGVKSHITEFVGEAARLSLNEHVTVLYLPIMSMLPPSQSVVEDANFREAIAQGIIAGAAELGIRICVIRGTLDERTQEVMTLLPLVE